MTADNLGDSVTQGRISNPQDNSEQDHSDESPHSYLTPEDRQALRASLAKIARVRREAEVQSENLRIG